MKDSFEKFSAETEFRKIDPCSGGVRWPADTWSADDLSATFWLVSAVAFRFDRRSGPDFAGVHAASCDRFHDLKKYFR
jgi:hypothetical protein